MTARAADLIRKAAHLASPRRPAPAVVKLFTLAFSLNDGATIDKRLARNADALAKKAGAAKGDKEVARLELEQKTLKGFAASAVRPADAPGLVAFLGYVLNFTTVLGGPAFDFREYCDAQARTSAELGALPGRVLPALWKWLQGVVYLAGMAVLMKTYSESGLYRYAAWRGDHLKPTGVSLDLALNTPFAEGERRCREACEASRSTCHADVSATFYGLIDIPWSSRPAWEFVAPSITAIPYARPLGLCGTLDSALASPATCTVAAAPINCLMYAEPRAPLEGFAAFVPYAALTLMIVRVGYYAFWKLSEGAAVLAGFGFRDKNKASADRRPALADALWLLGVLGVPASALGALRSALGDAPAGDWEGVSNVNPITVETRTSMRDVIVHWNCQVQSWLANYIFKRTPSRLGPIAKANKHLTMLASAVWHGFFPGYYLSFATAPFIQECTASAYASFGAFAAGAWGWAPRKDGAQLPEGAEWLPLRLAWGALRLVFTFLTFAYSLAPFVVMRFNKGIAIWAYAGFLGHLLPFALMLVAGVLALLAPRAPRSAGAEASKPAPEPTPKSAPSAGSSGASRRQSSTGAGAVVKGCGGRGRGNGSVKVLHE
jgi:hypothetical protein